MSIVKSKVRRYQPRSKYQLQILAYNGSWITIASTSYEENYKIMKTSQKYFEYKRGIPCRIKYIVDRFTNEEKGKGSF